MTDMNHPTADHLEAFVEGVLEASDRVVLESHLLGCPECQAAVKEWQALFAALSELPQLEPKFGFADRVMARVRLAPRTARQSSLQLAQAAVQKQLGRAGSAIERILPRTTFGWAMATAFLALPFLIGGALLAWLMSRSYITPASLWAFFSTQAVEGARSVGGAAVSAAMQTEVAAWLVARSADFLSTAGVTGLGVLIAAAAATTLLSIWVLYRNLIRSPSRETHYASYSF
ncbi:hypothetical protein BH23GEM9_BH23GEM9_11420 [soil metagenome]